jgi:phenylalanyl-tRNA synthetase alpha chain
MKKRQLLTIITEKTFKVSKGKNYAPDFKKLPTTLTAEMIRTGEWKNMAFKKQNWNASGVNPNGGHLHPLLKVRSQFRQIFLEMGFNEMPTDKFVESSFWNFDALIQPQSHPARDMHDTFFIKSPKMCKEVPEQYALKVKEAHEHGLENSRGYEYDWKMDEAMKNILRTHTTAVSSQMLYNLANQEGGFKPMKYFSIDRVFRNETLDATHLAEFHQCEGVIADYNIGLSHLLGIFTTFFEKIGIKDLKYKPAYNPYTEPSLEIFGYHPTLKRWVEIGNSGVFRPEMLEPMGLPKDVSVIAWGLSLERPTMIYYDVKNIRDLFGHKVSLASTKKNPICMIQEIVPAKKLSAADQKMVNDTEEKLSKSQWLGGAMPSSDDKTAIEFFMKNAPKPASQPNTYNWFSLVTKFSDAKKDAWPVKKAEKKKAVEDDDDIDMFGSDDEDDEASFDALCKAK